MKSMTYSAPGKVILSGEHSVVYTKPAFVTAINLHLTLSISEGDPVHSRAEVKKSVEYCTKIVQQYLQKHHNVSEFAPFQYHYSSTIPEGRGLGSSAAFCVATVAALLHYYLGHEPDKQTVGSLAHECEKHFHGMPSGVDVSASCYGGLIFYRKEFEFLKTISALNFKIPKDFQDRLILIDSGKPEESTKEMVSLVGRRYNAQPKAMDLTLSEIEKVTKRIVVSIVKEDLKLFGQSIADNQSYLEDLGIVSSQTRNLIKNLSQYGMGKVTGAGGIKAGSGYILFLVNDETVYDYLEEKNIPYLHFISDYQGVQLEKAI